MTNPLCGPRGAAATYGPQKGADPTAVEELDTALATYGRAIEAATGRLVADLPGAGAAGGTTAALLGFTSAAVRPGVEVVAELVGLAAALEEADLVITGEGRADGQTLSGKAAMGVATLAGARRHTRSSCSPAGWATAPRPSTTTTVISARPADPGPSDGPGRGDGRYARASSRRRPRGWPAPIDIGLGLAGD